MRTLSTMLLFMFLLSGCASRQLANKATVLATNDTTGLAAAGEMRFTYEVKEEFSTEYFGMVGFVLENNTNEWMTIDSITIISDSLQQSNINITGGGDIGTWFTSMNKVKQIEATNRQRLWGTISLIATVGAVSLKDKTASNIAAATALGSGAVLTLERYNAIRNQIDLMNYFPEDHLMRTPFRIPPGLGVDKWMVVNTQVRRVDVITPSLSVTVHFNGGKSRSYQLDFLKQFSSNPNPYAAKTYTGIWQRNSIRNVYKIK